MPRTSRNKKKESSSSTRKTKRRLVFDEDEEGKDRSSSDANTTAAAATAVTTPNRKRASKKRAKRIDDFLSSPPSSQKAKGVAAVVTPAQGQTEREQQRDDEGEEERKAALSKFVPTYIHKNVGYVVRSKASAASSSTVQGKVFDWICQNYEVPVDFEQQRRYGPLSGSSYEGRVIQEYALKKLERKKDKTNNGADAKMPMICTCCATVGHTRNNCPTLI